MSLRQWYLLFLVFALCLPFSGCALLQLPGTLIQGTFSLLGQLIKTVGKLPMPPPWIFI